jgi:hypothetical protein
MRIVQIGEISNWGRIKLIGTIPNGKPCSGCYFHSKSDDCEIYFDKLKVVCFDSTDPFNKKTRIFIKL